MDMEERIALLQEQMLCVGPIYTFRFDAEGNLKSSNCPEQAIIDQAFGALGWRDKMLTFSKGNDAPLWISSPIGLEWIAAAERKADEICGFCVLGPCLNTEITHWGVEKAIQKYESMYGRQSWARPLIGVVKKLPVLMQAILVQDIKLLFCCVAGKSINATEIVYCTTSEKVDLYPTTEKKKRNQTWMAEQALLKMVRDGDLNYRGAYNQTNNVSNGVPLKSNDHLRQAKTSVIVFTSLCVRQAIEGGLSPDLAYSLGDMYIQNVESSQNTNEIATWSLSMYEDFIQRVHQCRVNPKVSRQIHACCDFIEMHVEDELSIEDIAQSIGYTKYYFSRRFKEEMGVSVTDYIKAARIERAKLLLTSTDLSIQDIADRLHYCSRSYFSTVFLDTVGSTPTKFREKRNQI